MILIMPGKLALIASPFQIFQQPNRSKKYFARKFYF